MLVKQSHRPNQYKTKMFIEYYKTKKELKYEGYDIKLFRKNV